jgi:hypothetical protein
MSIKVSKNKRASLIYATALLVSLIACFALYFSDNLHHIFWVSSAFVAVYLVLVTFFSERYSPHFRKHASIYRVILAVAFAFLVIALLIRPTFYLAITFVGLSVFDLTLGIILIAVWNQNKLRERR